MTITLRNLNLGVGSLIGVWEKKEVEVKTQKCAKGHKKNPPTGKLTFDQSGDQAKRRG